MSDLIKSLRKDFPADPRIAGSPDMELMWKAADKLERQAQRIAELECVINRTYDLVKLGRYQMADAELRKALAKEQDE